MKPFNLEEYLTNPNKKLVTRDGRKLKRILCTDAVGPYPIVALVKLYDGITDRAIMYTKEGMYLDGQTNGKDLFFKSERHKGWMNLYKGGKKYYPGKIIYPTEEEALKGRGLDYITTIKIEWEE